MSKDQVNWIIRRNDNTNIFEGINTVNRTVVNEKRCKRSAADEVGL